MVDLKKLIRKNIRNLKPYSSARDEFSGTDGIFLDANESPFGDLNRYPDPYQQELKSVLGAQKGIDPKKIFVGNGSDEVIDLLFRIFCEPRKDTMLTFTPTYGMYQVSATINDVNVITVPMTSSFRLDIEKTCSLYADENIKLTFVCTPNNPTGNAVPHQDIIQMLESAQGIVVVDEAYIDFSETDTMINLIDSYPNLVVMQTMSKARGLAAARVGFAFASEAIVEVMNKVKPPYNVSKLNQKAAIEALNDTVQYKSSRALILSERAALCEQLLQLKSVKKVYPSDANFLLVEFNDASEIYQKLINKKIVVRNRNTVVNNCIRITVGTRAENNLLINELKQIENEKSTVYRS